jgi:hypothetical protein
LATTVSTRLTSAEGRRFGLTVGTAFLVLAGVVFWREHTRVAIAFASLGTLFIAGGLLLPTRMGPVMAGWMRLALAISKVTTPIIMSGVYFVVITPIGVVMRWLGRNPLVRPERNSRT